MSFPSLPNPFSSSSSSSSSTQSNTTSPSSAESTALKNQIMQTLQTEGNVQNAKYLIQKVNENCFNHCIPADASTSLTRSESTCLSACMEKYIEAWNTTSRTYIARISREAPGVTAAVGGAGGAGLGGLGGMQGPDVGKEMF
ncbi:hypothetical protein EPUS_01793 [Endocarpon pusillum Z07020]|uniref:Mitochondrial import inner membrane translocase subunit n=1 Tax=Endocarpon pusillum (strain Z07020 / HMAS-L-300199) TaxID=1263415 RepID=U1GIC5_ENDPU|nr:uncharacterized protein EPUS_01793 [Endocarpon pusillum Z07020]ERF71878.1 hypothetical protein EPUS_01793 [Endocarpon pusillum Z07020]